MVKCHRDRCLFPWAYTPLISLALVPSLAQYPGCQLKTSRCHYEKKAQEKQSQLPSSAY